MYAIHVLYTVWGQNKYSMNRLIILQKRNLSTLWILRHETIKLPDKILMENCLLIGKSINFGILLIFNHWFTLSFESHSYETSSSSEGLLKVKTVNIKKYSREAIINNAVSSWNNIQKFISSYLLSDLWYSKLKSLLLKHIVETYSNNY